MKRLLLLVLCALFACQAEARTLYVNAKRPNNNGNGLSAKTAKKTIQAAINVAKKGDTILVYPGTYAPIKTNNKKIAIKSVKGEKKTKIARSTNQAAMEILASLVKSNVYIGSKTSLSIPRKGKSSRLIGFVLDGMYRGNGCVAGITGGTVTSCTIKRIGPETGTNWADYIAMGSTLVDCKILQNRTHYEGLSDCSLQRCRIEKNNDTEWTAVDCTFVESIIRDNHFFFMEGCTFSRCKIADNEAYYAYPGFLGNCKLFNCLLSGNRCNLIYYWFICNSSLINCTVVDNFAYEVVEDGEATGMVSNHSEFHNCILRNNYSQRMWFEYDYDTGEDTTHTEPEKLHNADAGNVYKNTDTTNKDPKFANAAKGNYKLKKGSYCIDKGKLTKKQKKQVGKKDLAGKKRIKGKAIDRGCYEY